MPDGGWCSMWRGAHYDRRECDRIRAATAGAIDQELRMRSSGPAAPRSRRFSTLGGRGALDASAAEVARAALELAGARPQQEPRARAAAAASAARLPPTCVRAPHRGARAPHSVCSFVVPVDEYDLLRLEAGAEDASLGCAIRRDARPNPRPAPPLDKKESAKRDVLQLDAWTIDNPYVAHDAFTDPSVEPPDGQLRGRADGEPRVIVTDSPQTGPAEQSRTCCSSGAPAVLVVGWAHSAQPQTYRTVLGCGSQRPVQPPPTGQQLQRSCSHRWRL